MDQAAARGAPPGIGVREHELRRTLQGYGLAGAVRWTSTAPSTWPGDTPTATFSRKALASFACKALASRQCITPEIRRALRLQAMGVYVPPTLAMIAYSLNGVRRRNVAPPDPLELR